MSKVRAVFIDPNLIGSKAFNELNGSGIKVFLLFLKRRQFKFMGKKGHEKWTITNNGEIVFTYADAIKKFGISRSRFARALDKLIEVGFIDIAHHGGGLFGDFSKYSISERWKNYGNDKFIVKVRPKDTRGLGFAHSKWEKQTRKKHKKNLKTGIENDTGIKYQNSYWNYNIKPSSSNKINTGTIRPKFFTLKDKTVFIKPSALSINTVTIL